MTRSIILGLTMVSMICGQTGLDILTTPTDARDASLGLTLNPTVKPTRNLTNPETVVTLSVWNWVADIQGAYMGVAFDQAHLSFQALNSGELEYRDERPSDTPLSTFEYNIFNSGGSYAWQLGSLILGVGGELIYERSLNASATSFSLNLAAASSWGDHLLLSGGIRHTGIGGALGEESSLLPSEIWVQGDASFKEVKLLTEVNTGSFPLAMGAAYTLFGSFEMLGGLQVETAENETLFHPSAGFTALYSNFTLGYSMYQINHALGARHFITLFWNY